MIKIKNFVPLDNVQAVEKLVGNKKILSKTAQAVTEEAPGYLNDGLGGTHVRETTEDLVYDYLGRFIGKRTENKHYIKKVNENGRVYTPQKPFLIERQVEKEAVKEGETVAHTGTNFEFKTGVRSYRQNVINGEESRFDRNGVNPKTKINEYYTNPYWQEKVDSHLAQYNQRMIK